MNKHIHDPKIDLTYYEDATYDIEKKIISSFVYDDESRSEIIIKTKPIYFNNEILKRLFEFILDFYKQKHEFDVNVFISYLKTLNHFQLDEIIKEFSELYVSYESINNLNIYMETLSNLWMEKQAKLCFSQWLEERNDSTSIPKRIEDYYKTISEISNAKVSNSLIEIKDVAEEFTEKLEHIKQNKGKLLGTTTGYTNLDSMLNGFKPGELIILAARPSIGKTALALNFLLNAAKKSKMQNNDDEVVLMFSLEMSNDVLFERLISCESRYNIKKFQSGNFSSQEDLVIQKIKNEISSLNIKLDQATDVNILDIQAKIKQLARDKKIKLVIIDYLQLIDSATNKNNRAQEVAYVSRTLKLLALELKIPILAIAQLSRNIEQRAADDKKPKLSDLRESGAIEQDADIVMFLDYDRTQQNQQSQNENKDGIIKYSSQVVVQVTIAKNRNGETGETTLIFDKSTSKYLEDGSN